MFQMQYHKDPLPVRCGKTNRDVLMSILERLTEAMKAGEILTIVYHGGSQPGTKREIYPIIVSPDNVRARDIATGIAKNFLVSKIELVPENCSSKEYNPDGLQKDTDLTDLLSGKREKLESLGWHIKLSEKSVGAYRYFKNGKLRKTSDVGICKREDNNLRPWYVWSLSFETAHTFLNIAKACELFLEEALKHAPNKNNPQETL